jgi:hypothetical protein
VTAPWALRSGTTVDLVVADRNAVFRPDMSGTFVDARGGRLFQVVSMGMGDSGRGAAKRAQEQAAAIAELAITRMTPADAGSTAAPAGHHHRHRQARRGRLDRLRLQSRPLYEDGPGVKPRR